MYAILSGKHHHGFTLIELLVVISIIAILSVVGFVAFQNVTKNAKDARIKADLNAIKKAYETNFDPTLNGGQGGYQPLKDSDFAGGKIPTQPNGNPYTYAYGPDAASPNTDGYRISATLSSGKITVSSTQGTAAGLIGGPGSLGVCPDSGLTGYWNMDDVSWIDSINSNNGSVTGGVTNIAGKFGNAGSFNNGYIQIGDKASLDFGTNFTLSAWVNPTGSYGAIISKIQSYGIGRNGYDMQLRSGLGGMVADSGYSEFFGAGAIPVNVNIWTHVALTYNGSNLAGYINGFPVEAVATSRTATSAGYTFRIGSNTDGESFPGLIDEVRVYNRELSGSEISALYSCVP